MLVVRYLALAALVVWLGGMVTLSLLVAPSREALQQFDLVAYGCGGLIVICLLVLKFVGPPPAAFVPRLALVVLMLAVAAGAGVLARTGLAPRLVVIALGFVLLFWYVRE
jgi:hypothetical protein